MKRTYKVRQSMAVLLLSIGLGAILWFHPELQQPLPMDSVQTNPEGEAAVVLDTLSVKGRAPKTDYSREQFGDGWMDVGGCDMRNVILHRDLKNPAVNEKCQVISGTLHDPYTSKDIAFSRGAATSDDVQIDHVVALSDAWQKGAQQLSPERREQLANDPLELIAVDGPINQQKGDGDAATWLPPNKSFRCQYVARQIAIKKKYDLWVTQAEKDAMKRVLSMCPGQTLPAKGST
jgi:hypothetical protein